MWDIYVYWMLEWINNVYVSFWIHIFVFFLCIWCVYVCMKTREDDYRALSAEIMEYIWASYNYNQYISIRSIQNNLNVSKWNVFCNFNKSNTNWLFFFSPDKMELHLLFSVAGTWVSCPTLSCTHSALFSILSNMYDEGMSPSSIHFTIHNSMPIF